MSEHDLIRDAEALLPGTSTADGATRRADGLQSSKSAPFCPNRVAKSNGMDPGAAGCVLRRAIVDIRCPVR